VRLISRDPADPSIATIALVGGGDPLLTSANLRQLARDTHTALAGLGVNQVSVLIDDELFPKPSPAAGWRGSYGLSTIAPVRALNRDRRNLSDSSKDAAQFFVKRLREAGTPARLSGRGERSDPNTATELAIYRGHTVAHAVRLMSVLSDNDIAENLFRHVAIARGYPPTWQGAANAFTAEANNLGIPAANLKFVDGSGLSRENRLTPNSLVQLLQISLSGKEPALTGLSNDTYLARAGKSGTLRARYENDKIKCSKGEIYAKTGSLRDVSALAGVANGVDGHRRVFAVLVNGPRVQSAPRSISNGVDSLATTLVGCR
jgi:D-alanyl-D-alanine carboxypeptidase/D-alanyl-D-alanine-endopeptidase (penicillin-binding protein 4)